MSHNETNSPLQVSSEKIEELRQILLNQNAPITERIRTVFTLRHINTPESIEALKDGNII